MPANTLHTFIGAGMIAMMVAACSSAAPENNTAPTEQAAQAALPVDAIVVKETTLEQTETVAGSLIPNRTVDIMSELSKKVVAVLFRDGSYVQAGQELYKLEDADIRARMQQLQAELNLAQTDENRMRALLKTETVRQEEYDVSLAKLQALQAAFTVLQVELSKTRIRAPFSGIIGISKVFTGTYVTPGMPLVSLQEQDNLKIAFPVAEKYLPLLKPGKSITFTTDISTERMTATVIAAEASVDMQTRNILVQAIIPNKNGHLKAGMSAKVYFNTAEDNATGMFIPTEALIPGGNGYSVFLVKNGTAKMTPVSISNRNDKSALISTGVNIGDTVMISNLLRASDGIPVSVVSNL